MTLVPVVSLTDDPTCTTNLTNHVACVPLTAALLLLLAFRPLASIHTVSWA